MPKKRGGNIDPKEVFNDGKDFDPYDISAKEFHESKKSLERAIKKARVVKKAKESNQIVLPDVSPLSPEEWITTDHAYEAWGTLNESDPSTSIKVDEQMYADLCALRQFIPETVSMLKVVRNCIMYGVRPLAKILNNNGGESISNHISLLSQSRRPLLRQIYTRCSTLEPMSKGCLTRKLNVILPKGVMESPTGIDILIKSRLVGVNDGEIFRACIHYSLSKSKILPRRTVLYHHEIMETIVEAIDQTNEDLKIIISSFGERLSKEKNDYSNRMKTMVMNKSINLSPESPSFKNKNDERLV